MEEGRKKPKILLLQAAGSVGSAAFARLSKALKTFTDLEERSSPNALPDASALPEGYSHVFVDTAMAAPATWPRGPARENVTLVQGTGGSGAPDATTSFLTLDGISAGDLVRILHLYLVPFRQAGVAPVMEKGSVILGEKLMDMHNVGLYLDRVAAYFGQVDKFALEQRVPDLRQVLSALLFEAYRNAKLTEALHPAVDFQLSASAGKIAVNLRFPAAGLDVDALRASILAGEDLFWTQAWQCSDLLLLTYHVQHDELEVLLALFHPERPPRSQGRSLLFRRLSHSARKGNLLVAPESYAFKLVSEIRAKETTAILVATGDADTALGEVELGGLPPEVLQKIRRINEEADKLRDQVRTKEALLQEASTRYHETSRELNMKRGEVIRAGKLLEAEAQKYEKRIRELETRISDLRRAQHEKTAADREQLASAVPTDSVRQLENLLRAAENERAQLRETIANEKRKATIIEQKYSALFRDNAQKERELLELKASVMKFRKDAAQAKAQTQDAPGAVDAAALLSKLKEAEDRELHQKMELRKLQYKVDSHEKGFKAVQNEAGEKLRLLDQKLKEAKAREMELLRKIEELTGNLKKAKAA